MTLVGTTLMADDLMVSNPGSPAPIYFSAVDSGQVTQIKIGGWRRGRCGAPAALQRPARTRAAAAPPPPAAAVVALS
jgi:hypothetical protein